MSNDKSYGFRFYLKTQLTIHIFYAMITFITALSCSLQPICFPFVKEHVHVNLS